jgi:hypothetical protein
MSYVMINLCNPKVICIVFLGFFLGQQNPIFTAQANRLKPSSNNNSGTKNQLQTDKLLVRRISECQKINTAYKEIYSFETENYNINVCQLGSNFYYYRQAKSDQENALLIPAQAIFNGDAFQATSGKTTYFVGRDGDRYYSSVMENNQEIVFEPEVKLPQSSLSKKINQY